MPEKAHMSVVYSRKRLFEKSAAMRVATGCCWTADAADVTVLHNTSAMDMNGQRSCRVSTGGVYAYSMMGIDV